MEHVWNFLLLAIAYILLSGATVWLWLQTEGEHLTGRPIVDFCFLLAVSWIYLPLALIAHTIEAIRERLK